MIFKGYLVAWESAYNIVLTEEEKKIPAIGSQICKHKCVSWEEKYWKKIPQNMNSGDF